jgi:ATP-dependent helicase Lhr and Lhr-like helicase
VSAFDRLDPLVQHHIVNSLGWRSIRPLQEASIGPVLDGKHCLLLAPTAGGKTEAAMFPIFSRMIREEWKGTSLLYITPLKALLNNLHQRLEGYAQLLGRECEVWHGDVSAGRKNQIRKASPDIILTTPESLEGMLVSTNPAGREMLKAVRCVVVDEIHAFAGDDRGWHLLAILERLVKLSGRELQRVGLSATVGNPDRLLEWFAGHCLGQMEVVAPPGGMVKSPEITLDYVGTLANAALVISRLHRGEKRLVFCDSRSRVEELASLLRAHQVQTYLSHSSLSVEERRTAERAFAESKDCVIVSTSTLELGIDVGDLDRVIQIDAPNTVASFLQRLGRTGRRSDTSRNCLFLATSPKALLRAAALLYLWESGFVEPVVAPPEPIHLLSQQIMALALQEGGIGECDWRAWVGRLPAFASLEAGQVASLLRHLKEEEILFSDGGILGFGAEGEALFGRRHFLELLAVFSTPNTLTVLSGLREIGQIESGYLFRSQQAGPLRIVLGGRFWVVDHVDWRQRTVQVQETSERGRGAWIGSGQGMSPTMARGVQTALTSETVPEQWSVRAKAAMEQQRKEFSFLSPDANTLVVSAQDARIQWYTFGGSMVNQILSQHLTEFCGLPSEGNELSVSFDLRMDAHALLDKIHQVEVEAVLSRMSFDPDAVESLKFHQTLPPELQQRVLRARLVDRAALRRVMESATKVVFVG